MATARVDDLQSFTPASSTKPPVEAQFINAGRPLDELPRGSLPFRFARSADDRSHALNCLAAAAWYEAGDDPAGERAVIQVVLNRVNHRAYPKSVCAVVFQGSELSTGCQFTFTCDGALARRPSEAAWHRARSLAEAALSGAVEPAVGEATHYHANYVYPYWAPKLIKLAQVGAHLFYRFPGRAPALSGRVQAVTSAELPVPLLARIVGRQGIQPNLPDLAIRPDQGELLPATRGPIDRAAGAMNMSAGELTAAGDSIIKYVADPAVPAGRWAVEALARCRGRDDCRASAWSSLSALELSHAPDARRPVFIFVRDKATHKELALWDCSVVKRASAAQCLPGDPAAVRRLLLARPQPSAPSSSRVARLER